MNKMQHMKSIAGLVIEIAYSQHQLRLTAEAQKRDDCFSISGKITIPELQQEKEYEWKMHERDFGPPAEETAAEMVRKISNNVRRFVKERRKE